MSSGRRKNRMSLILEADVICDYGCGQQAYYRFKNGKVCCCKKLQKCPTQRDLFRGDKNPAKRPGVGEKISEKLKGCQFSENHRKNMSISAEIRANRPEHKIRFQELMFSSEAKKKRKITSKGRKSWNKNLTKKDHSGIASYSEKMIGQVGEKSRSWKLKIEIRCDWCGKLMKRLPCHVKETNFCCRNHRDIYHSNRLRNDPDRFERAIKATLAHKVYKQGHFYSVKNNKDLYYQSSYEFVAFEILEQLSKVRSYDRANFRIPYMINNEIHYTVPDILITYTDGTKELIEVKAKWFLHDEKTNAKFWAMNDYAATQGWDFNVWTEKELGLN